MDSFHLPLRIFNLIPFGLDVKFEAHQNLFAIQVIHRTTSHYPSPFPEHLASTLQLLPFILATLSIIYTSINPKLSWVPKNLWNFLSIFKSLIDEDEIRQWETNHANTTTEEDPDRNNGFLRQQKRAGWMIVIALLQSIAWTLRLGYAMILDETRNQYLIAGASLFAWVFILFHLFTRPPQTPSYFLLVLFLLFEASILVSLFEKTPVFSSLPPTKWFSWGLIGEIWDFILCSLEIFFVLKAPIRAGGYEAHVPLKERIRLEKGEIVPEQEDLKKSYLLCPTSPEDYTDLLSILSYSWMNPIQSLALKRSLLPTDIWKLRKINGVGVLSKKFGDLRATKSSLMVRILTANAQDILKDVVFKTTGVSLAYAGPALMKKILESIEEASHGDSDSATNAWTPRQRAFVFACIALLLTFIRFISELLNFHAARQVGLRIRITLVVECFEKALRRRDLSGAVASESQDSGADLGKIVNIMATDINTLLRMGCDLHQLYGAPVEAIVAISLLYGVLGKAAFVGLSILLLAVPVNYYLGNLNFKLQRSYSASRDVRISLTNEMLGSIKFLKLQGVDSQWSDQVLKARETELKHLLRTRITGFMLNMLWSVVPILVSFSSFLYYVRVQKEELTIAVIFTAITLFTLLRSPLNVIPTFFLLSLQALVSVRRLEGFLNEEEVEEAISALSKKHTSSNRRSLAFDQATFSWHGKTGSNAFQLRGISFDLPESGLVVIAGPTSSGKSSLLAAILGEMKLESGIVRRDKFVDGKSNFSFAGQTSWLEAGRSIKDNIIFTSNFDEKRYRKVLTACALDEDLAEFEDGDETRVSSHTLSGGQKARIALSRCLYSASRTLILDDVLSAVDTQVQQRLYETLQGPLVQGRRVILVTHHLGLVLPSVSHLILLQRGEIEAQGSPTELQARGLLTDLVREEEKQQVQVDSQSCTSQKDDSDLKRKSRAAEVESKTPKLLYELEKRREGAVRWSFWSLYIRASSPLAWLAVVLLSIAMRVASTGEQLWLKMWGEAYSRSTDINWILTFPPASGHEGYYLNGLALIGLTIIGLQSILLLFFYFAEMQASRFIYARLLSTVIGAPLRFFNITPQGRILQRFTGDMAVVDDELPSNTMGFLAHTLSLITYLGVCLFIVPGFLVPSLLLLFAGPWIVNGFLAATRDMQRIESTSTSPIYSQFQEALEGISVIRSFGAENIYLDRIITATSNSMSNWWAICTIEVWLSFRSQILGGVAVFCVTLLALTGAVSAGSAGMVMTSAALLTQITYYVINDFKHLNNNINSIERIAEYMDMDQEASSQASPPAAWPTSSGFIIVQNLSLRYAPELPEVLRGISFEIKPLEKIGIVGRSGSGKSSLASSFFRATELSGGSIWIDGIDISKIKLEDLRKRLSIVAQDPVLFSGTIRTTLDPFDEHSDEELLNALRQVQISGSKSGTSTPRNSGEDDFSLITSLVLDSPISAGGSNLSAGQGQLLSLARALLRDSRVVILDEATSSTDLQTDALIQKAIRSMSQSIVITVAHRLKSVIDYDRIIVLQNGHIVELDTPFNLLSNPDGIFTTMCKHAGSREYAELRKAAGLGDL